MHALRRGLALCGALALIGVVAATANAQQLPVRVVQGNDGALYVLQGGNSWTLVPDAATDSDVAALNPSGEIDGTLPNELFVTQASSPSVRVRVIDADDGTLFVVRASNSWTLVPDQASDSDIAALAPGGEIDGTFPDTFFVVESPTPAPPVAAAPTPTPAPVAAPSGPTSGICSLVPSELVGCWPGNGNAKDLVGGNDGILEGGAGFAPGIRGQAFSFNGKSQFVRIPMGENLTLGGPASVVFWMRADPKNPLPTCCQGLVDTYTYDVEWSPANGGPGGINFGLIFTDNPTYGFGTNPYPARQGEWHHVVGPYDGSAVRLYIDGVLNSTAEKSGNLLPRRSNDYWAIGSEDGRPGCPQSCVGNRYFYGLIEEVMIYTRAINEQEVATLFKGA